jgi:hypothetical protein
LGAELHWTDAAAGRAAFAGRAAAPTRRRERSERIALANRILCHYGLKLADFEGRSYVLRAATGRQEVVADIVGIWGAAERLAGRLCDPLDPELIARLDRA